MSDTSKAQVRQAVAVINEWLNFDGATIIDDYDGAMAINVEESGFDAIDISHDATIHGALPRRTFLEPINLALLRLVRA